MMKLEDNNTASSRGAFRRISKVLTFRIRTGYVSGCREQ